MPAGQLLKGEGKSPLKILIILINTREKRVHLSLKLGRTSMSCMFYTDVSIRTVPGEHLEWG